MKTKLLRRLRKRFTIQQRNNEYTIFDKAVGARSWIKDMSLVIFVRRYLILETARKNYKPSKKTL
tara:strand:- start:311 stop:505 length:195 start_codon:yes stop_codon:yes gene_type:complete